MRGLLMAKIPRTLGTIPDIFRDIERRLQLLERSRTKQTTLKSGGGSINDGQGIVGPGGGVVINPGGTFDIPLIAGANEEKPWTLLFELTGSPTHWSLDDYTDDATGPIF